MKQAVRGSITSCTRTVLPHLLKPAEARCGQYGTTEDPLEETDFPEHQISQYHISKITLISFNTTIRSIMEYICVTQIQALVQ